MTKKEFVYITKLINTLGFPNLTEDSEFRDEFICYLEDLNTPQKEELPSDNWTYERAVSILSSLYSNQDMKNKAADFLIELYKVNKT